MNGFDDVEVEVVVDRVVVPIFSCSIRRRIRSDLMASKEFSWRTLVTLGRESPPNLFAKRVMEAELSAILLEEEEVDVDEWEWE